MKAFQVLWTPPLYNRSLGGLPLQGTVGSRDDYFPDYYLTTMIMSVLQWKRNHQDPITLYGDSTVINYFSTYKLLELWDGFDYETLNAVDKRINPSCFYSAGKFFAYLKESAPCVIVDLDLILWNPLDFGDRNKVLFTHWESVLPPTRWYCPPDELQASKHFKFDSAWDLSINASNTSIVFFPDEHIKNLYAETAISFMIDNPAPGDYNVTPELLYVEQRLLPMMVCSERGAEGISPILQTTWTPAEEKFTQHDPRIGEWKYFSLDKSMPFTHLWIAKKQIERDEAYRRYMCRKLLLDILAINPLLRSTLCDIPCLQEHISVISKKAYALNDDLDCSPMLNGNE
ncbi:MAG: hypothetical protein WCH01_10975 [Methylococcaceae bacterium]